MHTVFKEGDSTDKSNYRPLQMLSIPSKILKATVCRNIDNFNNENALSNENQWGFIKGWSTEGLLIHLTEKWKIALDNGNVVGVVFIDFKKALDCVLHSILDLKLQGLGFSGSALEWIRDYLKCHCQRKPGRSKSSRSVFDLRITAIENLPEKIINGGIFRSWCIFYFKIKIFL